MKDKKYYVVVDKETHKIVKKASAEKEITAKEYIRNLVLQDKENNNE